MDVDSDEDLSELEVYLYSQIHHAPSYGMTDGTRTNAKGPVGACDDFIPFDSRPTSRSANAPASGKLTKTLANRYWSDKSKLHTPDTSTFTTAVNDRQSPIVNKGNVAPACRRPPAKPMEKTQPNTASDKSKLHTPRTSTLTTAVNNRQSPIVNKDNVAPACRRPPAKPMEKTQPNTATERFAEPVPVPLPIPVSSSAPVAKKKNLYVNYQPGGMFGHLFPPQTCVSQLRINPAATSKQAKQKSNKKLKESAPTAKQNNKSPQKLEKAKRISGKREQSKKVRSTEKRQPIDIIVLDSSSDEAQSSDDDEDDDDIIEVPVPPPPVYTISDSEGEDDDKHKPTNAVLHIEENAMNAEDIKLVENTSFAKPMMHTTKPGVAADGGEKTAAAPDSMPPSRCVSPASVMSSDDFIGQNDRCRLADDVAPNADDHDIQLLSADIDSLMDALSVEIVSVHDDNDNAAETDTPTTINDEAIIDVGGMVANESTETVDDDVVYTDFVTPARKVGGKNYRVNEGNNFNRALDVYESESDLTESVYSKGAIKPTVIRNIANSSDEENIEQLPYTTQGKTKRLRKRRASSSNKGSDLNNDDSESSSEEDSGAGGLSGGVHPTPLPFIAQGVALEQCKTDAKSSTPAENPRVITGMSDDEFIANLNNLVQGCFAKRRHTDDDRSDDDDGDTDATGDTNDHDNDDDDDDDAELEVSARDIAAAVLKTPPPPIISKSTVVAGQKKKTNASDIDIVTVSVVSSDSEEDDHLKTTEPLPKNFRQMAEDGQKRLDNALSKWTEPGNEEPNERPFVLIDWAKVKETAQNTGGVGWNQEMRKFYKDSWNGEGFCMKIITQPMNRDKDLWRMRREARSQRTRNHHLKCRNCMEFGHTRARCKQPKKGLVCYMCGTTGHTETRCPDTMCLRCGNKTNVFTDSCNVCSSKNYVTCALCKVRGHNVATCPDKWRRYHSTINRCDAPNPDIEYNTRRYCSACGRRGHLFETCRSALRLSRYPPVASVVKSHSNVYVQQEPSNYTGIPLNLLYDPDEDIRFRMTQSVTGRNCYGRFLQAVGMSKPLSRKRKHSGVEDKPPHKKGKRNEDVIDLDGSNSEDDVIEMPRNVIELNVEKDEDDATADKDQFKTPAVGPRSNTEPLVHMDSDSNYSFSEHFDMATPDVPVAVTDDEQPCTSKAAAAAAAAAVAAAAAASKQNTSNTINDDQPDYIPLNMSPIKQKVGKEPPAGISNRFVSCETDDEEGADDRHDETTVQDSGTAAEVAGDAKVHLSTQHSSYLLSQKGAIFLNETAATCNIQARLVWSSIGYVLVIHGFPKDQDDFHGRLLKKYEEINEEMHKHRENSTKVPKRIDALIRFLREHISLLLTNIGSANELMHRLPYWEKMQSKNSLKLAERARRSLNMILLGQAGLCDGDVHLKRLLVLLRQLLLDCADVESAPRELRNEIDDHWKVIFSPMRRDNYPALVRAYNQLKASNELPVLNIDPFLLGRRTLDVNLTAEQRDRLEQPIATTNTTKAQNKNTNQKVEAAATVSAKNGTREKPAELISLNVGVTPKGGAKCKNNNSSNTNTTNSITINTTTTTSNVTGKQGAMSRTDANTATKQAKLLPSLAAQSINTATTANTKKPKTTTTVAPVFAKPPPKTSGWQSECDTLLKQIDEPAVHSGGIKCPTQDSKAPSMFWSRESLKYIESSKAFLGSHPMLQEQLTRVENKAVRGSLSYNDYRAIIKLNSALKSK